MVTAEGGKAIQQNWKMATVKDRNVCSIKQKRSNNHRQNCSVKQENGYRQESLPSETGKPLQ